MNIKQDDERLLKEGPDQIKKAGYKIEERDDGLVIITKGSYFSIGHPLLQYRNALFHSLEVSE